MLSNRIISYGGPFKLRLSAFFSTLSGVGLYIMLVWQPDKWLFL